MLVENWQPLPFPPQYKQMQKFMKTTTNSIFDQQNLIVVLCVWICICSTAENWKTWKSQELISGANITLKKWSGRYCRDNSPLKWKDSQVIRNWQDRCLLARLDSNLHEIFLCRIEARSQEHTLRMGTGHLNLDLQSDQKSSHTRRRAGERQISCTSCGSREGQKLSAASALAVAEGITDRAFYGALVGGDVAVELTTDPLFHSSWLPASRLTRA